MSNRTKRQPTTGEPRRGTPATDSPAATKPGGLTRRQAREALHDTGHERPSIFADRTGSIFAADHR